MRKEAAALIRQIRADVRAGACSAARRDFNQLVPLIGRMGPASKARVKSRTVARLWGLVESCRWKPGFRDGAPAAASAPAKPAAPAPAATAGYRRRRKRRR